ncbi:hypothetical protein PFISCL1PPCAC_12105, partial [Pristionchus fissidentatus]
DIPSIRFEMKHDVLDGENVKLSSKHDISSHRSIRMEVEGDIIINDSNDSLPNHSCHIQYVHCATTFHIIVIKVTSGIVGRDVGGLIRHFTSSHNSRPVDAIEFESSSEKGTCGSSVMSIFIMVRVIKLPEENVILVDEHSIEIVADNIDPRTISLIVHIHRLYLQIFFDLVYLHGRSGIHQSSLTINNVQSATDREL